MIGVIVMLGMMNDSDGTVVGIRSTFVRIKADVGLFLIR